MAKARKQKNDEQKAESSGAVVRHQKICLSIDMENKRLYGYTELTISLPESGIIGLHADNMKIESILLDGEPAAFEFFPHYQHIDDEKRWECVNSMATAADAASLNYISSLEKEMAPNLLILCKKAVNPTNETENQESNDEKMQTSLVDKNVKLVHVDYWAENTETGIHFRDNIVHTDNQIRRAHCWFPCIDNAMQRCCYDLELTVDHKLVAVSNGTLLYQVLGKDDPPCKTYVYKMDVPVTAESIALAVAPFEILPDRQNARITHLCLPSNLSNLRHTVAFFSNCFSYYEEYLAASFPFGSYKQVFIMPEMAVSSMSLGASMCIFSSQLLFDEKVIDQTIDTGIKLALALARQWFGVYITAETPNDEWLLDGLSGFLTDLYIKRFLGNNEARYRRYKANCAVCKADTDGATALSSSGASGELYGTQRLGIVGKIRSWKAVSILQMLEKQMGPESFRKILQTIICNARSSTPSAMTLGTKGFRHFANKVGNLERPFLKEFFPRWVESCGCPILRMGLSYNKRRNMIELAVLRGCTAPLESIIPLFKDNIEADTRVGDVGWPGMMSIRVHELDGMYDHPSLPMSGDSWQLLEMQCHSKLAAKRIQRPKKGSKPDGSDDNGDVEMRSGLDSPLLWVSIDPEMEYLAEVHFHQPVQMWISQLEKDKDVVAQSQAIETLAMLPHLSFAVINALNNFLNDSKAFWRVRVEAAFALAHTACEESDWAGLQHLIMFYKSRRFDQNIGLPKANDFHDFSEYFVLEAIPHAIARVRAADNKSPREAVEFVLQLLKYNDNNGNPYSDVYWLAALVQSIGELEFGQQTIGSFQSLLKRIDRLLQFDRLMTSYNGILTLNCIRTVTQIALKLSLSMPLDRVVELIKPFQNIELLQVRIEARKCLLDLEFNLKGLDGALILFMQFINEESSLRGQIKLASYVFLRCQSLSRFGSCDIVNGNTVIDLLRLLGSVKAFNNVFLRHQLFCILHTLGGRPATLYGIRKVDVQPVPESEGSQGKNEPVLNPESCIPERTKPMSDPEVCTEEKARPPLLKLKISKPQEPPQPDPMVVSFDAHRSAEESKEEDVHLDPENCKGKNEPSLNPEGCIPERTKLMSDLEVCNEEKAKAPLLKLKISKPHEPPQPDPMVISFDACRSVEASKEADAVSNATERKLPVVKIKVRQNSGQPGIPKVTDTQHLIEISQGRPVEIDLAGSSSASVDAPVRVTSEPVSISNQNIEEVNSSHDHGSRMTASVGSAKFVKEEVMRKELQCTADSKRGTVEDKSSPNHDVERGAVGSMGIQTLPIQLNDPNRMDDMNSDAVELASSQQQKSETKVKKKERDGKRKHDDPEYLERKRQKKLKKKLEKEKAKKMAGKETSTVDPSHSLAAATVSPLAPPPKANHLTPAFDSKIIKDGESKADASEAGSSMPKIRLKFKGRSIIHQSQ